VTLESTFYKTGQKIVAAEGFEATTQRGWRGTFSWDGETESPRLVYHYNPTRGGVLAAGDGWMLVSPPRITLTQTADGESSTRVLSGVGATDSVTAATDGVVASGVVYLGPYTEHDMTTADQHIRLIVPAAADLRSTPAGILDWVGAAANMLTVGTAQSEVVMVASPEDIAGGGIERGGTAVVPDSASADRGFVNLWVHEYVHTRQSLTDASGDMEWFKEASAEYYAALIQSERLELGPSEQRAHFERQATAYSDAVLAEPGTWSSSQVPYTKGEAVLYALDQRIQQATNGQRSLVDVFARLNQQEAVTLDSFKQAARDVAGEDLDHWIERYVATAEAPPVGEDSANARARTRTRTTSRRARGHTTPRGRRPPDARAIACQSFLSVAAECISMPSSTVGVVEVVPNFSDSVAIQAAEIRKTGEPDSAYGHARTVELEQGESFDARVTIANNNAQDVSGPNSPTPANPAPPASAPAVPATRSSVRRDDSLPRPRPSSRSRRFCRSRRFSRLSPVMGRAIVGSSISRPDRSPHPGRNGVVTGSFFSPGRARTALTPARACRD
jgi:hypothetical protein